MFNQVSYNVVIERFKVFADGHFLIRRFSHGQVDVTDIDKDQLFPWMHVAPVDVRLDAGARIYSFDVIFADMPRDKEDATDYQREVISDCVRLCEDLVNEIANGGIVFGEDVELEEGSTITPFIAEYTHTLCGATLAISISVPNDYSACDIPANWSIGGGGSSTPPAPSAALILKVNTVDNVNQTVLDITQGANITITDLGDGRVKFDATGDLGTNWGTIGGLLSAQLDLQGALDLKADISSLGAVAFSNDYNDLDNLPTIPAAQVNSDWNATSGVEQILNKPTLATVATSGSYLDLSNQPTIPAAQVNSDWNATSGVAQILNKPSIGSGTVTSVGLTMPIAFAVTGSPVTGAGTLAVTGAGTTEQYVRGDGTLANFPATGGGGGQIFYFNGNTSQGTISGNPYYQLSNAAGTGAAANFTRATTGVIARFITDVGQPNHLILPAGAWTIDVYLSETGGGSNHAEILAKIYTYNGTSFTLISTSPVEQITNGNVVDLYTFTLSMPNTATLATDRVYIEFDIQNTNGKTVTLYTEDSKIGEVHTTYAIGLSSLNGLTANTQNFAVGTSGTDFGISSVGSTHTFNLPSSSASARGALSSADWSAFNAKQDALVSGTNIKTLEGQSLLGSGNIDLTKSDVGLSNVDNTSDANKPISTATQTALNAKQDTLVSGSSIKTVNSTSLLGSGDVAVQATLVSGTNIKTINSISLLGSGNIPIATSDSTIFSSNPNATQGANSTGYWAITGSLSSSATENFRNVIMPVAGTLKNLYVRNGTTQSSTGTMVFTVRKNGADNAMTVTFSNADGAATTKSDTTNTVSVVAGDLICIKGINNAPGSASGNFVSFTLLLER